MTKTFIVSENCKEAVERPTDAFSSDDCARKECLASLRTIVLHESLQATVTGGQELKESELRLEWQVDDSTGWNDCHELMYSRFPSDKRRIVAYPLADTPLHEREGKEATVHELKIWPEYFDDVESGKKNFEVRKLDRLFGTGDTLWLREWSPTKGYTGRETRKMVTYLMAGGQWGLSEGNCIMGIATPTTAPTGDGDKVIICLNCKSFHFFGTWVCDKCGGKTFTATHPLNKQFIESKSSQKVEQLAKECSVEIADKAVAYANSIGIKSGPSLACFMDGVNWFTGQAASKQVDGLDNAVNLLQGFVNSYDVLKYEINPELILRTKRFLSGYSANPGQGRKEDGVEFAEWCSQNKWSYLGEGIWGHRKIMNTKSTELYTLFTQDRKQVTDKK